MQADTHSHKCTQYSTLHSTRLLNCVTASGKKPIQDSPWLLLVLYTETLKGACVCVPWEDGVCEEEESGEMKKFMDTCSVISLCTEGKMSGEGDDGDRRMERHQGFVDQVHRGL